MTLHPWTLQASVTVLSLYPGGGAEDVDEQEVGGEDDREVFDALVRGGRDLEAGRNNCD